MGQDVCDEEVHPGALADAEPGALADDVADDLRIGCCRREGKLVSEVSVAVAEGGESAAERLERERVDLL
jgi:hypothetical protein